MPNKVWDEITYPFPNFNGTVEVWEWVSNFIQHFITDVIACKWLKLNHVSDMGTGIK